MTKGHLSIGIFEYVVSVFRDFIRDDNPRCVPWSLAPTSSSKVGLSSTEVYFAIVC